MEELDQIVELRGRLREIGIQTKRITSNEGRPQLAIPLGGCRDTNTLIVTLVECVDGNWKLGPLPGVSTPQYKCYASDEELFDTLSAICLR